MTVRSVRAGSCLHALAILETPGVVTTDDGKPVDVLGLSLRDAHVLRALFTYAGIVPEEAAELSCENCGKPFRVVPSSLLEVGPFVDHELDDPELDAPFEHDKPHSIPRVVVGKERARTIRIAQRSVRDALPLWHAEVARTFRFTPAIITAVGITHLGGERRASVIAEALSRASGKAYRAIADLLHEAHYSRRLVAVVRCSSCGGRNDLDVPWVCEIPYETSEGSRRRTPFPDVDTFEKMVKESAERIYRKRGVRNIDLVVDDDVPACDDGGEPLLGCYTPGGTDELGIVRTPEIRIFYRTFDMEQRRDASFDVGGEIEETIDHEVTHHLHDLAGDDPLDDEERDAIEQESIRRVGQRETARRVGKGVASEFVGFLRTMWPILLIGLIATWLGFCR